MNTEKFIAKTEKKEAGEKRAEPHTFLDFVTQELKVTITPQKVIQVTILIFMSVLYCVFKANEAKEHFVIVGTSLLVLVANLTLVLIYQFKKNHVTDGQEPKPHLPEFDYFYAVCMPILVCLVTKPDFLPVIIGSVFQITDLPAMAKIAASIAAQCQISVFKSTFLVAPVVHFGLTKVLDFFAGPSLSKPEKQMGATLLVSLFFGLDSGSLTQVVILQKLTIALFVALAAVVPVYLFFAKQQQSSVKNAPVAVIYALFACVFCYAAKYQLTPLGIEPLQWIWSFYKQGNRIFMLVATISSLGVLIPALVAVAKNWHISWRRKAIHFILVGVTGHPLFTDYEFHMIFFIVGIGQFVVFEFTRALRLPPFGDSFAKMLDTFLDHRDRVCRVVSAFIVGMIGFLLPVLWAGAGTPAAASTLITVGLGDSFASVIGSRYGYHKWWNSKKSIEGTLSHITACVVGLSVVNKVTGSQYSVLHMLAAAVVAGLLEGTASINDNVIVPASMFVVLQSLAN